MKDRAMQKFLLPPMSGVILVLTVVVCALPMVFGTAGLLMANSVFILIALCLLLLIAGVWLWMRPSCFEIDTGGLTIVWPLRKFFIPRENILGLRILDSEQFREEFGLAMRIGVGGLFGGFGLLWTNKRGMIRFYVTGTDRFVLIERSDDRSILISVDDPGKMLRLQRELHRP